MVLPAQSVEHGGDTGKQAGVWKCMSPPAGPVSAPLCAGKWEEYSQSLTTLLPVGYVYVSDQTVRNQLHKAGIRAQYPSVVPVLIHQRCAAQLAFTREQQDWQVHYCYPILLIDVAGNIMFSMVSPGHPFWCFLVNSRHTARCWAVSTGPA